MPGLKSCKVEDVLVDIYGRYLTMQELLDHNATNKLNTYHTIKSLWMFFKYITIGITIA